jgi:hypothetical protein
MAATAGLLIIIAGWRGILPQGSETAPTGMRVDNIPLRLGLGTAGLLITFIVTGWPVAAFYGGLGGYLLPTLAAAKRHRRETVDRVEAIATWVESLRDTMAASAGIQEAIRASAPVAPGPVRSEVRNLSLRMQHQSVAQSLRSFAADMTHPLSDMVVASLILATSRQAGSLQDVLAVTAKGARDSAAMWRQVESRRARTYSQARLAGWVSFLLILFLVVARRGFLEPFDSFGGQIAMFFIGAIFFASGISIYLLSRPTEPRRLFSGIENWSLANSAEADR